MNPWFKNPVVWFGVFLLGLLFSMTLVFNHVATMMETKQTEVLTMHQEQAALIIEERFESIATLLQTLSKQIILSNDDGDLYQLFYQIDQENDFIASIYFGRPDKTMINSTGFVPPPSFDLTTRLWYIGALASDGVSYTDAFINATQDRVIVVVSHAIYQGETLLGVVAADIDIRSITLFLQEMAIGESGFAFLYDQNNHLIAYPNLDPETVTLDPVDGYEPNLRAISGSGFRQDFSILGEKGALFYTTILATRYTLGVFMPLSEYSANFRSVFYAFLVITLITALSGSLLIGFYQKQFQLPLKNLIFDIGNIDLEMNPQYRLPEKRKGYSSIRKALNRGLELSASYVEQRNRSQHQLVMENQRVRLLMESTADIIFEINTQKVFVSIFGKGLEIFNLKPEDVVGKNVNQIFGDVGKARDQAYTKALQGEHLIYDWTYQRKGELYYFESSIAPMYDENNHIIGAVGVSRNITEPMKRQLEIQYMNEHDFLTGVYNRRFFVESLERNNNLESYPLGILMIDVNGLKIFNDAYGHEVGDQVLKEVAKHLQEHLTKKDILARIGGDEFAILVTNTSKEELQVLKDSLQALLLHVQIANIPLSVAIGYCLKTDSGMDFEEVIKVSENMMYRNKITEGKSIRNSAIKAILKTLTDKYQEEKVHSSRVSQLCKLLGEALHIRSDDLKELELAGLFHDIGKISIPDAILDKPGKLTKEEYEIIKNHTENGYHILRAADEYSNLAEFALSHHEHWNGKGYPRGLQGEAIPLFSRIICIADAFEAMTSDRVYRKKRSNEAAAEEIIRYAGTQFDPTLAKVFVEQVLKLPFELVKPSSET